MIAREQIEHIAKLAKLKLTETEIALFTQQIGQIVDYVAKLNELDTTGVAPATHALPRFNVFREDLPQPSLDFEQVLANAPECEGRYFRVPRILE